MKVNILPEGVTQDMVDNWKKQYGDKNIKLASLVDKVGNFALAVIIRVPDRVVLGEHEKYSYSSPLKAKEILVKACVLSHKEEVLADDQLFFSAYAAINEVSPLAKATVEDL